MSARDHATKAFASWVVAGIGGALIGLQYGPLLGWPSVDYPVTGEVVETEEVSDGTVVTFAGRGGDKELRWSRTIEDSS